VVEALGIVEITVINNHVSLRVLGSLNTALKTMASPLITVTVKALAGELLLIETDPSKGLQGVADVLTRHDSTAFPHGKLTLSFLSDEQTELVEGSILMVCVESSTESIAAVDSFLFRGNLAYRIRIKADRTKSLVLDASPSLPTCRNDQYFDICYYPATGEYMSPRPYSSLKMLETQVGKRYKRLKTIFKLPSALAFSFRHNKDRLQDFDDERMMNLESISRIRWTIFTLFDDAIVRISDLVANWIVTNI
jgi:hypothetical protein